MRVGSIRQHINFEYVVKKSQNVWEAKARGTLSWTNATYIRRRLPINVFLAKHLTIFQLAFHSFHHLQDIARQLTESNEIPSASHQFIVSMSATGHSESVWDEEQWPATPFFWDCWVAETRILQRSEYCFVRFRDRSVSKAKAGLLEDSRELEGLMHEVPSDVEVCTYTQKGHTGNILIDLSREYNGFLTLRILIPTMKSVNCCTTFWFSTRVPS